MKELPLIIMEKWQNITNILSDIMHIPAALIMYTENEYMEVLVSSQSEGNPYHPGDKDEWSGLYCQTVITSQQELLVPNALKDKNWDHNPDLRLGMISYLGYPINYPDQKPFGTICVLDRKENTYSTTYKHLLLQFKDVIEDDLHQIQEFKSRVDKLESQILDQNAELHKKNRVLKDNEALLKGILDNLPDAYIRTDLNGNICLANPMAVKMYGFSCIDEIIGMKASSLYANPEDWDNINYSLNKPASVKDCICESAKKNGTTFWSSMNMQLVKDGNKHVIGTEGVIRDISKRVKFQMELIEAKKKAEDKEKELRNILHKRS